MARIERMYRCFVVYWIFCYRCLSKALVQAQALTPKCRELVLIAAPKDSRVYLQYPESASALVQKVAELQRAAGACLCVQTVELHCKPVKVLGRNPAAKCCIMQ